MTDRQEHRQVSTGRASAEATRRFGGALRREVGDLEVRLEEAQLRSDAFLRAGLEVEAARVLDESRDLVDQFHERLNRALAEAAVEREAEQVLASSSDVLAVLSEDETTSGGVLSRIPAGIGAAVASVAVLAMAIVTMRAPAERDTRLASDITAEGADTTTVLPSASPRDRAPAMALSPIDQVVLADITDGDRQAAAGGLLAKRRQLLDLLSSPTAVTSAVLAELDAVVEQLRTEGVDIDKLLELERSIAEQAPQEPEAQEPEAQEPQAPSEQEPTSTEPEGESSEEDGGVFGGFGDDESEDGESADDGAGASGSGESDDKSADDDGVLDW